MLRPTAMPVASELQSKLRIKGHSPCNIRRSQHYKIESYVVHGTLAAAEKLASRSFIIISLGPAQYRGGTSCKRRTPSRPLALQPHTPSIPTVQPRTSRAPTTTPARSAD